LPEPLYQRLVEHAQTKRLTPEQAAIEILSTQFEPQHPYVEMLRSAGGVRAVIRGTRTGVDAVIGYSQAGYSPEEIAADVLPHLTLAEVYDALSYYVDHQSEIDHLLDQNTPEAWRQRLVSLIGEQATGEILGEI